MAVTLTSTLAGEYSNSYVDIAYCDAYWSGHYSTTKGAQWSALTDGQKTRLLIQACRIIETARFTVKVDLDVDYSLVYDRRTHNVLSLAEDQPAVKYYYYQALQFPRSIDRDTTTGETYIPEPIKEAQCEQAVYTLNFDDSILANVLQGVATDSLAVGDVRIAQTLVRGGSAISPVALEHLKPFLLKSSSTIRRA
jgi:hypothetical protein